MYNYKKKRSILESPLPEDDQIIYLPCKFCHSSDYDFADGLPDENGIFEPESCDVCGFKLTVPQHSLTIQ